MASEAHEEGVGRPGSEEDSTFDESLCVEEFGGDIDGENFPECNGCYSLLDSEFDASSFVLGGNGSRRIFVVQDILRARGAHRPSFEFLGRIVEVADSSPENPPGSCSRGSPRSRVVAEGLTLSLRYEPPSAKFRFKCPGFTSYRIKVSKGGDFLYSRRGLPQEVLVDWEAAVAAWGQLEMAFGSPEGLARLVDNLKHVEVRAQPLELPPLVEEERPRPGGAGSYDWPRTFPSLLGWNPLQAVRKADEAIPGASHAMVALAAALLGYALGRASRF
uniref:Uncharacterized protein n=1 Tax=Tetraselmis sp. GSL018 TaxID=582737 RepID=A0A061RDM6_9CHLO|mmetsp:Transcript_40961/g.97322  ORF Transcript_40961/g.97322 Transcript_40961/m.97322 type:complete len:275 (-) Transcript_40961:199-1023(-)|eukprot:CAMPEP_0177591436 /NCGR_PEP_ID=MMETSP0419_2-20121207/7997_1 /TAXON_ID=582737 /ORGANISM="Tetraselmis sp., Strain GSL018" /LENGTH=274 /DNA_ID=CAMNT_0019082179 /DNA_START=167 /DNA_END=991 /DNA_ORIENTATION=+